MKVVLIVWSVFLAATMVLDGFVMHYGKKDREAKDRLIEALYASGDKQQQLIEALFANRDAQRDQIKELRRKSAALEHLLDLCINQEKKKEERDHDRAEDAGH